MGMSKLYQVGLIISPLQTNTKNQAQKTTTFKKEKKQKNQSKKEIKKPLVFLREVEA